MTLGVIVDQHRGGFKGRKPGKDSGKWTRSDWKCFNCDKTGHFARNCKVPVPTVVNYGIFPETVRPKGKEGERIRGHTGR